MFTNFEITYYTGLAFVLFFVFSRISTSLRPFLLIIINSFFLLFFISYKHLIGLFFLSALIYKLSSNVNKRKAYFICIITLLLLVVVKDYSVFLFLQEKISIEPILTLKNIIPSIGFSYIFFKIIHFVNDKKNDLITSDMMSFPTFLSYILFFPSFTLGPIGRYQEHFAWINLRRSKVHKLMIFSGFYRLFEGYIKIYISTYLVKFTNYETYTFYESSYAQYFHSLCAYSIYLCLNFSGASSIAIGLGMLFGIKLPENFNSPFISTNIRSFWSNWHISLMTILRQYIFIPVVKKLNRQPFFQKQDPIIITITAYFVVFLFSGLWHGTTIIFLVWGFYHAFFASLEKLISRTNWFRKIFQTNNFFLMHLSKLVCQIYVFTVVSIGWMFFIPNNIVEFYNNNSYKMTVSQHFFSGHWGRGIKLTYRNNPEHATLINVFIKKDKEKQYRHYHKDILSYKELITLDLHGNEKEGQTTRNLEKSTYNIKVVMYDLESNKSIERIKNVEIR